MYYYLYNPDTDTHYTKGGFIDPDQHEKPEGFEWVQGYPPEDAAEYVEETPALKAEKMLATLPAAIRAKHYGTFTYVEKAISRNELDVVPHLLAAVQTDTTEEAEALAAITEALTSG